jgi:ribonucleoside-diphosphate reductase alpha chain
MTKNPEVRFAKSIVDYIFRWMATKFLSPEAQFRAGVNMKEPSEGGEGASSNVASGFSRTGVKDEAPAPKVTVSSAAAASSSNGGVSYNRPEEKPAPKRSEFAAMRNQEDAPPCSMCGSIMVRSGSCYKCQNCGTTSGCA